MVARPTAIDTRAAVPRSRNAGVAFGARGFRVRACRGSGPARSRCLAPTRSRSSSTCRAWPSGTAIAAFALSEPEAGSDVAALQCQRARGRRCYVLNGEKTWISNGGIADFYVVFARTGEGAGREGDYRVHRRARIRRDSKCAERIEVIAPHPLARLAFKNCRIAGHAAIG